MGLISHRKLSTQLSGVMDFPLHSLNDVHVMNIKMKKLFIFRHKPRFAICGRESFGVREIKFYAMYEYVYVNHKASTCRRRR